MNSEKDPEIDGENIIMQDQQKSNENSSSRQEPKSCNIAKIRNIISDEKFKTNNNIVQIIDECSTSNDTPVIISNRSPFKNLAIPTNYSNTVVPDNSHIYKNTTLNYNRSNIPSDFNFSQENHSFLSTISNDYNSCVMVPHTVDLHNFRRSNFSESSIESSVFPNVLSCASNESMNMRNNVDHTSKTEKCPLKVSCSSDLSPEVEEKWSSKCVMNNIGKSIGSTSQGTCCFLRPNIKGNKDMAGPSGLQKVNQRIQSDCQDSSSGNEGDLSDEEDHCIYTYKGDDDGIDFNFRQEFNKVYPHELEPERRESGRSSPEMDYLEMDFDPGPSCEQDTGDSDMASVNGDIQNITLDNGEADPTLLNDLSSTKVVSRKEILQIPQETKSNESTVCHQIEQDNIEGQPSTSKDVAQNQAQIVSLLPSTTTDIRRGEATGSHRSGGCPLQESCGYHNTNGDMISPGDSRDVDTELWANFTSTSSADNSNLNFRKVNLSSTLYHRMMAKKLMLNKQTNFNESSDSNLEEELCDEKHAVLLPVEKVMLWNEQEAAIKQVTQIATSACGATAAINAILALDVPFSLEVLVKGVATKLREPGTHLPRYLKSRSIAGTTHKDIERGMNLATNGALLSKFFAFYPERKVSLSHWLHYWISKGAVPIATLNLQHCGEGCNIPDAWHHQMIFGVGPAGIYVTNPLQCLPEEILWHQLVSPSILLIRRTDILCHWNPSTDLTPLMSIDHRWRRLNVLGQVVNMIRETMGERNQSAVTTGASHIRIPASYEAGITLILRSDSEAADELSLAEQLPLL